ncbi:MAG: hypothetical protein QMB11_12370 [Nonlabens sp.]|uniref:hypothetical protein n=1 Tax=Nonlabens sp. TaxID=1888209 RepID=UPI0035A6CE8F
MKTIFFLTAFVFSYCVAAQGDLIVAPKRVVFEGNKQKETIFLINSGTDSTSYSVSFVQKRMNEDGSFTPITESIAGQEFADPYLRLFPRRVTLAPGEGQNVVVQFRRKPEMLSGEYRSHLYFRSEQKYKALGLEELEDNSTDLSINLTSIFGISIPIIIRTGDTKINAALSDLKLNLEDAEPQISFTINRMGNISLYGNLTVEFIPKNAKPYTISVKNGIAVYTTTNNRNMTMQLDTSKWSPSTKGTLRVFYVKEDNQTVVYATTDLIIK